MTRKTPIESSTLANFKTAKSKRKKLPQEFSPPEHAWFGYGPSPAERKAARRSAMPASEAEKMADVFERHVEDQYAEHLLALKPGTRITDGYEHSCTWITVNFAVPLNREESLHSHLTALLVRIVNELCAAGFLKPRYPKIPDTEFVRTNKLDPIDRYWEYL